MRDWKATRLSRRDSLLKAMDVLNRSTLGIGLVVDERDRLEGVVVDGDVRRGVLAGMSLEAPVEQVMKPDPVTATAQQSSKTYIDIMLAKQVHQLPVVAADRQLVGLVLLRDLRSELASGLKAVVMAGGMGKRLRPLTEVNPKPLLSIADRPIMEHVLERLRASGIREVVVSTHYKSEMIQDYFGDGSSCGLAINYVKEENPFGTIGALRLMRDHLTEPFLVINGDVITSLDFSAMQAFHGNQAADMTVAVKKHNLQVPYGVVQVHGEAIVGLEEKPSLSVFINAGIYLINPGMIDFIPEGRSFDATDLIATLITARRTVSAFPVIEYWIDVGHPTDFERANNDLRSGRLGEARP